MRSTASQAFIFRHSIDLGEYLKINYQLDFFLSGTKKICKQDPDLQLGTGSEYENTWIRPQTPISEKSSFGIHHRHGNILTWEALKNDCSLTEARTYVRSKSKQLSPYKSIYLARLEGIAKMVIKRMTIGRPSQMTDYLEYRGLDYLELDKHFSIGSPGTYQSLVNFFSKTPYPPDEIRAMFQDLFIARRSGDNKYLPFKPAIVIPVYSQSGSFNGFHCRYFPGKGKRVYTNTGFLREIATEVLFGEENASIQSALLKKRQVILTKGIFDFFTCYQNDYHQVLATLNKGISAQQFDKVVKYPVTEIVVGFTAPKERDTILGLMHRSLNQVDLSLIDDTRDIDDSVNSGTSLSDIVANALKNMQASEDGVIAAALRKRKAGMDVLTEHGKTFLVLEKDLQTLVISSKRSPRKMKDFLLQEGNQGRQTVQSGNFIRFPKTFIADTIPEKFGAELRTLLHLLIKTKGRQTPINYTQSALCADLGLSQSVLIGHLKKLKLKGYLLLTKKPRKTRLKNRRKRPVVFLYYPSTIKFG